MNFHDLAPMIKGALAEHQCALCGVPIRTFLKELVCPHWFLVHGARGMRMARLAPVFELYELRTVMNYLRLLADSARPAPGRVPWREWHQDGERHVLIHFRRRSWQFVYRVDQAPGDGAIGCFQVTTRYLGEVVDRAMVELSAGTVRVTQLAREA